MRKQSERQLGAFIMVYTVINPQTPNILSDSNTSFRNRVIHEGVIPDRQEALSFGQAVLDVLRPLLLETKRQFPKGVDVTVFEHLKSAGRSRTTMTIATIVSLNAAVENHHRKPLTEFVKQIELSRLRRGS